MFSLKRSFNMRDRSCEISSSSSCRYLVRDNDGKTRCLIQTGEARIPPGESPIWSGRSNEEVVQETCIDWPHNSNEGRDLGGCCWKWVDTDGN